MDNVFDGALETNAVPEDVSCAMGMDFSLLDEDVDFIDFVFTDELPTDVDFYLTQADPDDPNRDYAFCFNSESTLEPWMVYRDQHQHPYLNQAQYY